MNEGEFFYKLLSPERVDAELLKSAGKILDYCRRTLCLRSDIKIQWVRAADPDAARTAEIFVKLERALNRMSGGGPEPEVRFRKDELEFFGQMGFKTWLKGKIMVRTDIPNNEVFLTIAHELKHFADFGPEGKYRPPYSVEEKRIAEQRAEAFAH